jgi:hypothetical protein
MRRVKVTKKRLYSEERREEELQESRNRDRTAKKPGETEKQPKK